MAIVTILARLDPILFSCFMKISWNIRYNPHDKQGGAYTQIIGGAIAEESTPGLFSVFAYEEEKKGKGLGNFL